MPEKSCGVLSLALTSSISVTSPSLVATPGALALAREVLQIEAQAVAALTARIDGAFSEAVDLLLACAGRVVVSGVGKSGHIARKIAATLASTGTPSMFVHAAEAAHGDLGMITREDVLLALSYSGEGDELLTMLADRQAPGNAVGCDSPAILRRHWRSWPMCTLTCASTKRRVH